MLGIMSAAEMRLGSLRAGMRGTLLAQGDANYDTARALWNGSVNAHPALIVRALDTVDVRLALAYAREADLPVAVRGGGHGVAGYATVEGGIVIDLSGMKTIAVDTTHRVARVEPGVTAGEFINAVTAQGLISTVGSHSTVGLAGLTLGGGYGGLMGKYGLVSDNLLAVEMVTADGELVRATATENTELFWGVRGGGGNFGIVTAFEYQLHPLEPVISGAIIHPLSRLKEVLEFYREFSRTTPDNLTTFFVIATSPDGHPVVMLAPIYSGPLEEGERVLAPLRQFGPPIADMIAPMPYNAVITMLDAGDPPGLQHQWKTASMYEISDEAIAALCEYAPRRTSPHTAIVIYHAHGAVHRLPNDATAFSQRDIPYVLNIFGGWADDNAFAHLDWIDALAGALKPYAATTKYVNFLDRNDGGDVKAIYGNNYARLQALKDAYDPTNVFNNNVNIRPSI